MDFEAKLEAFYNHLELNGTFVIDIGANIGRHTIPLAKKAGSAGFLHAFEPIPLIRRKLVENLALSGQNNVAIFPCAVSNRSGVSEFNYVPNLPEESGLKERRFYNATPDRIEKIQVNIFRLDDLVPRKWKVSFVKIDVEGGELDALLGAKEILEASRPIVAFECGAASFLGYHDTPHLIFDIFSSLEYEVFSIIGQRISSSDVFSQASRDQNFWDYIALPRENENLAVHLSNE